MDDKTKAKVEELFAQIQAEEKAGNMNHAAFLQQELVRYMQAQGATVHITHGKYGKKVQ